LEYETSITFDIELIVEQTGNSARNLILFFILITPKIANKVFNTGEKSFVKNGASNPSGECVVNGVIDVTDVRD